MPDFPDPKYVDDITCRPIWCELVQVLNGPPGSVKIELCEGRWTSEIPVYMDRIVPVARIAMTVDLARLLHQKIGELLAGLEQQTQLIQAPAASPTKN